MTTKILFLTLSLTILTGCDDPFSNFKPYKDIPTLGKSNIDRDKEDKNDEQ
jgi:hypothetical protein